MSQRPKPGLGRASRNAFGPPAPDPHDECTENVGGIPQRSEIESPASTAAQSLDDMYLHGNSSPEHRELLASESGSEDRSATRGMVQQLVRRERRQRELRDYDIICTTSEGTTQKQGSSGQVIQLLANCFEIKRRVDWTLYQYSVNFTPEEDNVRIKKAMVRQHAAKLGGYIFDGGVFFTSNLLTKNNSPLELISEKKLETELIPLQITLKFVGALEPSSPTFIQLYNIIVRKCQEGLQLSLIGRHYFDYRAAINISHQRLELWPGFVTVLRQYERNLLLCVEITHKVIRQDTVLNIMDQMRQDIMGRGGNMNDVKEAVRKDIVGTIVMTRYNRKTYRIDDIIWTEKASNTFTCKGEDISFVEYYKKRYDLTIKSVNQPLFVSNPKKADVRRGMVEVIKLIPELCQMTGLTEGMRQNFRLMKDLGQHLFEPPQKKVESISKFVSRIHESDEIQTELQQWGLDIQRNPIKVPGRILTNEQISFGNGQEFGTDGKADFTMAFRSCRMISSIPLDNWIIIVPQREVQGIDNLLRTMQNVSKPIGFKINRPSDVIKLGSINPEAYSQAITQIMNNQNKDLQMLFIILSNNRLETYASVKKRCYVDYGITSQCFLSKNLSNPKGLMSVVTKVIIQMNAKLGGEPWNIKIPLRGMMIVGFDVYHGGAASKGPSIGSMVATTTDSYGRYYSTMSFHDKRDEVSTKIAGDFQKCLEAYQKVNGALPGRIIFYRDGVGEGQLYMVYEIELEAIKRRIREMYLEAGKDEGKLTFIVVTKRTNTRLFMQCRNNYENPSPGTIVDDVVTWPERWDFYLIAPNVRQGTVSPTAYNILYERNGLDADKIQRLTYKLCHNYYNWSGTVAVPAPCQYAHKLAYLTGIATKGQVNQNLSHLLYFL